MPVVFAAAPNLHSLKYAELRKLAKSANIRANQKAELLIKALELHYSDLSQSSVKPDSSESYGKVQTKEEEKCSSNTISSVKSQLQQSIPRCVSKRTYKCSPSVYASPNANRKSSVCNLSRNMQIGKSKTGSPQLSLGAKISTPRKVLLQQNNSKTPEQRHVKKRRRTFELDEPTLSAENTPVVGTQTKQGSSTATDNDTPAAKRKCRTMRAQLSPANMGASVHSSSPGTLEIIDTIDANCSSAERKAKLLSALDKKVQVKGNASPANKEGTSQTSQIPRFVAFLSNRKKETEKPVTPGNKDWTKIHNKAFSKFDSIDVYLEKRQQRKEQLSSSVKKQQKPVSPANKISKAKHATKMSGIQVFKPSVTSVKLANFDFNRHCSSGTKTPKGKCSASSKTPKAKISTITNTPKAKTSTNRKTPDAKASLIAKTTKTQTSRTPARSLHNISETGSNTGTGQVSKKTTGTANRATPFKFTGNSSVNTSVSMAKKAFDLKASLARPLSWKPHTGKLQTLDCNKPLPSVNAKIEPATRRTKHVQKAIKNRPVSTRNTQKAERAVHVQRRNNQKYTDMMKRRGLL